MDSPTSSHLTSGILGALPPIESRVRTDWISAKARSKIAGVTFENGPKSGLEKKKTF